MERNSCFCHAPGRTMDSIAARAESPTDASMPEPSFRSAIILRRPLVVKDLNGFTVYGMPAGIVTRNAGNRVSGLSAEIRAGSGLNCRCVPPPEFAKYLLR